jgi:hypothetical protein
MVELVYLILGLLDAAPSRLSRIKVKDYSQNIPSTVSLQEFTALVESFANEVYASAKTPSQPRQNQVTTLVEADGTKNGSGKVDPIVSKYL